LDGVTDDAARLDAPRNSSAVVESDLCRAGRIFSGRIERHRPTVAAPGSKLAIEYIIVASAGRNEWLCLGGWHGGEEAYGAYRRRNGEQLGAIPIDYLAHRNLLRWVHRFSVAKTFKAINGGDGVLGFS
jgi:hypothetical protein